MNNFVELKLNTIPDDNTEYYQSMFVNLDKIIYFKNYPYWIASSKNEIPLTEISIENRSFYFYGNVNTFQQEIKKQNNSLYKVLNDE